MPWTIQDPRIRIWTWTSPSIPGTAFLYPVPKGWAVDRKPSDSAPRVHRTFKAAVRFILTPDLGFAQKKIRHHQDALARAKADGDVFARGQALRWLAEWQTRLASLREELHFDPRAT